MTTSTPRRRGLLRLLACVGPALGLALAAPATAQESGQVVTIVQLSGGIDAAYADYLRDQLRHAGEDERHIAVVLRLASSGSVKADVSELVEAVCDSPVPVVAWVGPRGEAVSGAATALWLAADVRLIAPGAFVNSAVPTAIGGAPEAWSPPCPVSEPAARLLAPGRRLGADELIAQGIAQDRAGTLFEAVRSLETVTVDGQRIGLDPQAADIRFANPGLIARMRQALATNPTLVYLLLLAGIGAIVFEAFQPGFGPAGYAGLLLVGLAAYGLVALPTNPAGLAVLLGGVGAMALDVRRNALGPLTWGGAVALAVGSWFLVHSDGPALRVPWPVIALGVAGSLVFYVVAMTVVLRALRGQSAAMGEALLGRVGEVRSTLNPQGHVLVEGALWRARAIEWDGPVPAGTRVTVTGVDTEALLLDVAPFREA